jgi:hypothetical protein
MTKAMVTMAAGGALLWAGTALAAADCQQQRYNAAAKYASCQQKALGKLLAPRTYNFGLANRKCTVKYAATWDKKLQRIGVAPCSGNRFVVNGDGTVTDNLTGLQWEQKTADSTVHDKDYLYAWSAAGTAADGTAFTNFLKALNASPGCFAGQCDWRLPTLLELDTIRALDAAKPYGCTPPCLDETTFGPTQSFGYWSATTDAGYPDDAWFVTFGGGGVFNDSKTTDYYVRAVRSGL